MGCSTQKVAAKLSKVQAVAELKKSLMQLKGANAVLKLILKQVSEGKYTCQNYASKSSYATVNGVLSWTVIEKDVTSAKTFHENRSGQSLGSSETYFTSYREVTKTKQVSTEIRLIGCIEDPERFKTEGYRKLQVSGKKLTITGCSTITVYEWPMLAVNVQVNGTKYNFSVDLFNGKVNMPYNFVESAVDPNAKERLLKKQKIEYVLDIIHTVLAVLAAVFCWCRAFMLEGYIGQDIVFCFLVTSFSIGHIGLWMNRHLSHSNYKKVSHESAEELLKQKKVRIWTSFLPYVIYWTLFIVLPVSLYIYFTV